MKIILKNDGAFALPMQIYIPWFNHSNVLYGSLQPEPLKLSIQLKK